MRCCLRILCLLLFVTSATFTANADTVTYTFDAPQFSGGERTPLTNRAPNIGLSAFRASFTSSPDSTAYGVGTLATNPLLSGQMLYDLGPPAESLRVTLNMPVNSVQFAWAALTRGPGRVLFTNPNGTAVMDSEDVGGEFQGGIFSVNLSMPFTSFRLDAFGRLGNPIGLAIDNLTMSTAAPIPEPATMLLVGTGLAAVAARVRKRRQAQ